MYTNHFNLKRIIPFIALCYLSFCIFSCTQEESTMQIQNLEKNIANDPASISMNKVSNNRIEGIATGRFNLNNVNFKLIDDQKGQVKSAEDLECVGELSLGFWLDAL